MKAIADFDEAVRLAPKLAAVYNNRAFAHKAAGRIDKAIEDWSEAIRLDPKRPRSTGIAVSSTSGVANTTKPWLITAARSNSTPSSLKHTIIAGSSHEKLGDKSKAEEDFAQAKKLGYAGE